jgi:hypothetical protein
MTLELGWKHALAGIALLAVLSVSVWLMVRHAHQQTVLDAERVVRIQELEDENELLMHAADSAHGDADEERASRQKTEADLKRTQRVIDRIRTKAEPALPQEINRLVLLEQNALLTEHLASAERETIDLRREIVHLRLVIDNSQERFDLMNKRYSSLKRSHKKERRRKILTGVAMSAGSFGLGFGMGRI